MAEPTSVDNEKAAYGAEKDPAAYGEEPKFENIEERRRSIAGGEAADIYGNVAEAEEFGYVERG
jgi:hypothetical protein